MKKRIFAALIAAATVLSLAGCKENKPGNSDGGAGTNDSGSDNSGTGSAATVTDTDDTLSVLAWSSNGDMPSLKSFFCEKTGTPEDKVKWIQLGSKGEEARIEYKKYLDGTEDADIILCDAEWALEYANDSKYTVPLSAIGIDKGQYTDAYGYTLEIGTNKNGDFVGATWQATPGAYVYNAETAEKQLGVKTPAEMQALVSDWAKFEETAQKLADKGVAICASEGDLWQVKQCERTTKWVGDDGKLVVDDFVKDFAQMAKDYADKGYITKEDQWGDPWKIAVQDGKALGGFAPTWGLLNNGSGTIAEGFAGGADVKGKLGLCEGPASWYWGGTFMEVTAKCNSSSLAKKWIETFTINADTMKEYAQKTGDFMNNKKVMEEMSKDTSLKNELFKDGTHQFSVLYNQVDKIKVYVTEYDGAIKTKFNVAVQDYAIKGTTKSVDEAIEAFKKDVGKDYADLV